MSRAALFDVIRNEGAERHGGGWATMARLSQEDLRDELILCGFSFNTAQAASQIVHSTKLSLEAGVMVRPPQ